MYYNRAHGWRRRTWQQMLRTKLHLLHCLLHMYSLLKNLLRQIKEAERICHILFSILSAIVFAAFLHFCSDFICFANSSEPDSDWLNMVEKFSAVRLAAVVSRKKSGTSKEVFRSSAVDRVSSWTDVDDDTVGKRWIAHPERRIYRRVYWNGTG